MSSNTFKTLPVFPTAYASVQDYVRNLNTNRAYADFRQIRAGMRKQKLP